MTLIKPNLRASIKTLMTDMRTREANADDEFADRLATIIHDYIKTATITVPPGQLVSTTGTAAAQTGATTNSVTANIT